MLALAIRTISISWTEDSILKGLSDDNRLKEQRTIKTRSILMEPLSQESRPPLELQARTEGVK